jgi:hypothetical protein
VYPKGLQESQLATVPSRNTCHFNFHLENAYAMSKDGSRQNGIMKSGNLPAVIILELRYTSINICYTKPNTITNLVHFLNKKIIKQTTFSELNKQTS